VIELFKSKKDCCCCAACMNICPKHAILMKSDEDGFLFPEINSDLCMECGLCKNVCAFQNISIMEKEPIATYVAINKNKELLSTSASGGIFGALASIVLGKKGVVFGCAYNENMESEHINIDDLLDIKKIQGSKYVQSNINDSYTKAKKYLEENRWVLFTGTPCQIAGLKSYLGKEYDKLITADLICHGVPSTEFFRGYIRYLEDKLNGRIKDFKFRDKSKGWGHQAKIIYEKRGTVREKFILPIESYYYYYFLKGNIYRESCYECKYACGSREGDFTMGDYWGVEKAHPAIETKNGVSVLLVNSIKGMQLLSDLKEYLNLTKSTFEQAREHNGQLNRPVPKSERREAILKMNHQDGYQAVANEYYRAHKWQIVLIKVRLLVPQPVKNVVKSLLGRKNIG
jgi:coenzyme F420-reducing hydrogenase beta subunit